MSLQNVRMLSEALVLLARSRDEKLMRDIKYEYSSVFHEVRREYTLLFQDAKSQQAIEKMLAEFKNSDDAVKLRAQLESYFEPEFKKLKRQKGADVRSEFAKQRPTHELSFAQWTELRKKPTVKYHTRDFEMFEQAMRAVHQSSAIVKQAVNQGGGQNLAQPAAAPAAAPPAAQTIAPASSGAGPASNVVQGVAGNGQSAAGSSAQANTQASSGAGLASNVVQVAAGTGKPVAGASAKPSGSQAAAGNGQLAAGTGPATIVNQGAAGNGQSIADADPATTVNQGGSASAKPSGNQGPASNGQPAAGTGPATIVNQGAAGDAQPGPDATTTDSQGAAGNAQPVAGTASAATDNQGTAGNGQPKVVAQGPATTGSADATADQSANGQPSLVVDAQAGPTGPSIVALDAADPLGANSGGSTVVTGQADTQSDASSGTGSNLEEQPVVVTGQVDPGKEQSGEDIKSDGKPVSTGQPETGGNQGQEQSGPETKSDGQPDGTPVGTGQSETGGNQGQEQSGPETKSDDQPDGTPVSTGQPETGGDQSKEQSGPEKTPDGEPILDSGPSDKQSGQGKEDGGENVVKPNPDKKTDEEPVSGSGPSDEQSGEGKDAGGEPLVIPNQNENTNDLSKEPDAQEGAPGGEIKEPEVIDNENSKEHKSDAIKGQPENNSNAKKEPKIKQSVLSQQYALQGEMEKAAEQQMETAEKALLEAEKQRADLRNKLNDLVNPSVDLLLAWTGKKDEKTAKEVEYEFMKEVFKTREKNFKAETVYLGAKKNFEDALARFQDAETEVLLQRARSDTAGIAAALAAKASASADLDVKTAIMDDTMRKHSEARTALQSAEAALQHKKAEATLMAETEEKETNQILLALKKQTDAAAAMLENEKPVEQWMLQKQKQAMKKKAVAESTLQSYHDKVLFAADLKEEARKAKEFADAAKFDKKAFEAKAELLNQNAIIAEREVSELMSQVDHFRTSAEFADVQANSAKEIFIVNQRVILDQKEQVDNALFEFTMRAAKTVVKNVEFEERTAFGRFTEAKIALEVAQEREVVQKELNTLHKKKADDLTVLIKEQFLKQKDYEADSPNGKAITSLIQDLQTKLDQANFAHLKGIETLAMIQAEVLDAKTACEQAEKNAQEWEKKKRDTETLKENLFDEATLANNEARELRKVERKVQKIEITIEVRDLENQLIDVELDAKLAEVQTLHDIQQAIAKIYTMDLSVGDFLNKVEEDLEVLKPMHDKISYLYGQVQGKDQVLLFIKKQQLMKKAASLAAKRAHVTKLTDKLLHNTTGSYVVEPAVATTPQELSPADFNIDLAKNKSDRAHYQAEIKQLKATQERILTEIFRDYRYLMKSFKTKMQKSIPDTCTANEVVFLTRLGPQIVKDADQEACAQDPFYKTIVTNKEKQKCIVEVPDDHHEEFLVNCLGGSVYYTK